MSKYKVGDKVRIVNEWGDDCRQNKEGFMDKWLGKVMTIRKVTKNSSNEDAYRMEEDKDEWCNEGWSWNDACIAGLATGNAKKIVITTDGKTTTAKMYDGKSCIKVSEARCCPSDTFDFKTGAEIAFNRLFEKSDFWGGFKAGKLCVKVNEENMPAFLKDCESHGIKWRSGKNATEFNPFECERHIKGLISFFGSPLSEFAYMWTNDGKLTFCEKNEKSIKEVLFSGVDIFDWNAFNSHKLAVKVTSENVESFLSEAEKRGCKWIDGRKPTELNPTLWGFKNEFFLFVPEGICGFVWSYTPPELGEYVIVEW